MKERPILFSGEMVKAILEGRKTQTRRVVKGAWHESEGYLQSDPGGDGGEWWFGCAKVPASFVTRCPYGTPGDRLWVKETWCAEWGGSQECGDEHPIFGVRYLADNAWNERPCPAVEQSVWYSQWRPSIFMPRWASRITLEIVSVRVEGLQEITEDDVVAEGIEFPCEEPETSEHPVGCVCEYRNLWDRINGNKHPWSSNPWVWRIEFKRV